MSLSNMSFACLVVAMILAATGTAAIRLDAVPASDTTDDAQRTRSLTWDGHRIGIVLLLAAAVSILGCMVLFYLDLVTLGG